MVNNENKRKQENGIYRSERERERGGRCPGIYTCVHSYTASCVVIYTYIHIYTLTRRGRQAPRYRSHAISRSGFMFRERTDARRRPPLVFHLLVYPVDTIYRGYVLVTVYTMYIVGVYEHSRFRRYGAYMSVRSLLKCFIKRTIDYVYKFTDS